MKESLSGKKIAFLATDGVEQVELTEPKKALEAAGATTEILAPKSGEIKAWKSKDWGEKLKVDKAVGHADVSDYDALVLPGGVINPDHLRTEPEAVQFVKDFARTGRPIAAVCHGPWTLIEAGLVRGKTMTSWPSLKTDLKNAGANWVDEAVVVDGNLITSRKPEDLDTFTRAIMDRVEPIDHAEPQRLRAAS
jgi:protease I